MSEPQFNRRRGITYKRRVTTNPPPYAEDAETVLQAPFPELRAIYWTPQQNGMLGGIGYEPEGDFAFVVTPEVLLATSRHVNGTLERELGGFLLGNVYRCPNSGRNYVIIDQYLEADYTEGTSVSLNFTSESWARLSDLKTGKFRGKDLVGWYHSHPRMNVFLSEHDRKIHYERFKEPWQTALVIEPEKHLGGFFGWREGRLDLNNCIEFYELLEGSARASVVKWENYEGLDLHSKRPPTFKPINTRTPAAAPAFDGAATMHGIAPAAPSATAPTGLPTKLPPWLQGNRLWFAVGGAALLALVFTVVIANKIIGRKTNNPEAAVNYDPKGANVLEGIDFELDDQARVYPKDSSLRVMLTLKNAPVEMGEAPQDYIFASIGNLDARLERKKERETDGNLVFDVIAESAGGLISKLKQAAQQYPFKARLVYLGNTNTIGQKLEWAKITPPKNPTDNNPIITAVKDKGKTEGSVGRITQQEQEEITVRKKKTNPPNNPPTKQNDPHSDADPDADIGPKPPPIPNPTRQRRVEAPADSAGNTRAERESTDKPNQDPVQEADDEVRENREAEIRLSERRTSEEKAVKDARTPAEKEKAKKGLEETKKAQSDVKKAREAAEKKAEDARKAEKEKAEKKAKDAAKAAGQKDKKPPSDQ